MAHHVPDAATFWLIVTCVSLVASVLVLGCCIIADPTTLQMTTAQSDSTTIAPKNDDKPIKRSPLRASIAKEANVPEESVFVEDDEDTLEKPYPCDTSTSYDCTQD